MLKSHLLFSSEVIEEQESYLSGVFDPLLEDRLGLTTSVVLAPASASISDWRRRFTRLLTLLALIVDSIAWVRTSEPVSF